MAPPEPCCIRGEVRGRNQRIVELHFVELSKFSEDKPRNLTTPFERWLHILKFAEFYRRPNQVLPDELAQEEGIAMALDAMRTALSREEVRINLALWDKRLRDDANHLIQAREDGRAEGRQEGRQEGRLEGRLEGLRQGLFTVLGLRFGRVPQELTSRLHDVQQAETLADLMEHAREANSLDAFMERVDAAGPGGPGAGS